MHKESDETQGRWQRCILSAFPSGNDLLHRSPDGWRAYFRRGRSLHLQARKFSDAALIRYLEPLLESFQRESGALESVEGAHWHLHHEQVSKKEQNDSRRGANSGFRADCQAFCFVGHNASLPYFASSCPRSFMHPNPLDPRGFAFHNTSFSSLLLDVP